MRREWRASGPEASQHGGWRAVVGKRMALLFGLVGIVAGGGLLGARMLTQAVRLQPVGLGGGGVR